MNWDALNAVAGLISAGGVMGSLIYLGLQIRGDSRARRAQTMVEQSGAFRMFLQMLAAQGDLADIYVRGIRNFSALEAAEQPRFSALMGYLFRVYEEHLFQWREGLLDARIWHGLEAPVDDILAYPGVQNWWTTRSGWYSEDFRIFIRGKIASASSPTMYGEHGVTG